MAMKKSKSGAGRKSSSPRKGQGSRRSEARPDVESETSGEILGAGQGGPSRHREGLSGSEGKGYDDKVIDSGFHMNPKKTRMQGRDEVFQGREPVGGMDELEEEETDVDIPPQSMSGDAGATEGHGRGAAPGAGA